MKPGCRQDYCSNQTTFADYVDYVLSLPNEILTYEQYNDISASIYGGALTMDNYYAYFNTSVAKEADILSYNDYVSKCSGY